MKIRELHERDTVSRAELTLTYNKEASEIRVKVSRSQSSCRGIVHKFAPNLSVDLIPSLPDSYYSDLAFLRPMSMGVYFDI